MYAVPTVLQSLWKTTPPGGAAVTVTAAVPFWPSLVAVIVAVPTTPPVTRPLPLTVATPSALLAQVTVRPVSTLPAASLRVAVNCCSAPTTTLALAGVTVTVATGAVLAVVVPLAKLESPPNTAFTFSVPRNATSWNWYATPDCRPSTVQFRAAPIVLPATGVAHVPSVTSVADAQEIVPAAKRMSYCAGWPVPSPTSVKERVTELAVTPATARLLTVPGFVTVAVTVIAAWPLWPSLVAVIVAEPADTAVTRPLPLTVATAVLPLAHVTTRPASGFPPASLGVAVSCAV